MPLDKKWVDSLKVADLKEELKKRGLPANGLKADLAKKLLEAILEVGCGARFLDSCCQPCISSGIVFALYTGPQRGRSYHRTRTSPGSASGSRCRCRSSGR